MPIPLAPPTASHLIGLETLSSAPAKKEDTVRFAVTKDVVLDGEKVIPVRTPVIGRVVRVKRRIPRHREGYLEVSLQRLTLSSRTEVPLTSSEPKYRETKLQAFHERSRNALENVGGAAFCTALLPICIGIELSTGDNPKPDGRDAVLPTRFPTDAWTTSENGRTAQKHGAAQSAELMSSTCSDNFKIDWPVSGAEMLVVE